MAVWRGFIGEVGTWRICRTYVGREEQIKVIESGMVERKSAFPLEELIWGGLSLNSLVTSQGCYEDENCIHCFISSGNVLVLMLGGWFTDTHFLNFIILNNSA